MKRIQLVIFYVLVLCVGLQGQHMQALAEGSEVKVDGSSTVSDWSVPVKQLEGKMRLGEGFSGKNEDKIHDVLIVMEVKSMEGRGPDMNEKIFKAFKAEEHPQIIFEATEAMCSDASGKTFKLSSDGVLKMAGQSQDITLILEGTASEEGYVFTGSHKLDMTTFGMEPPTAFFGSLEVEKEVTVIFNIRINT